VDPDPAFQVNPDLDPALQVNPDPDTDPDPVVKLKEKYTAENLFFFFF
jgi:hypothetical protein